jgi:hypothetical protein
VAAAKRHPAADGSQTAPDINGSKTDTLVAGKIGCAGSRSSKLTASRTEAMGLVSRVTPVHTALRNCARDEGWPFDFGNQVLISSHLQAAVVKSPGGEHCGKVGTISLQAWLREAKRKRTKYEFLRA